MKKRVQIQVTCVCRAYDFPHRITGGKCSGMSCVESYMEVDGQQCATCRCKIDSDERCEVLSGIEPLDMCEGYKEYLHKAVKIKLPKTLDEYMNEMFDLEQDHNNI